MRTTAIFWFDESEATVSPPGNSALLESCFAAAAAAATATATWISFCFTHVGREGKEKHNELNDGGKHTGEKGEGDGR